MATTKQPYIFEPKGGIWRWNRLNVPEGMFWSLDGYRYQKGLLEPLELFGLELAADGSRTIWGFCAGYIMTNTGMGANSWNLVNTGQRQESDPCFYCWGLGMEDGTVTSVQVSVLASGTSYRVFLNGVNKGDFSTSSLERYFATEKVYISTDSTNLIGPRLWQWVRNTSNVSVTGAPTYKSSQHTVFKAGSIRYTTGHHGVVYYYSDLTYLFKTIGSAPIIGDFPVWYQNHLFVANSKICYGDSSNLPTYDGTINAANLRWSDLGRPDVFKPTDLNEADIYNSTVFANQWVTGLTVYNDRLFVFYENGIEVGEYVGLPNVMKFSTFSSEIGGTYIATTEHAVYFANDRGIFRIFGSEIQRVDPGILGKTNQVQRPLAGCYDNYRGDVYFVTNPWGLNPIGGYFHSSWLIYNEQENAWFSRPVAPTAGQLTVISAEFDRVRYDGQTGRVFSTHSMNYTDSYTTGNGMGTYFWRGQTIETGWLAFGDRIRVKEFDTCKLDAWGMTANVPLALEGCIREFLGNPNDDLTYTQYTALGTSVPSGGRQSLPRKSFNYITMRMSTPWFASAGTAQQNTIGFSSLQLELYQGKADK